MPPLPVVIASAELRIQAAEARLTIEFSGAEHADLVFPLTESEVSGLIVLIRNGGLRRLAEFPRAGLRWTEAEEAQLRMLFRTGSDVATLSQRLGREAGAIRSRLRRLGLEPKE